MVKINEAGRKGRANLNKETQRAKNIDISYKLHIYAAGELGFLEFINLRDTTSHVNFSFL